MKKLTGVIERHDDHDQSTESIDGTQAGGGLRTGTWIHHVTAILWGRSRAVWGKGFASWGAEAREHWDIC